MKHRLKQLLDNYQKLIWEIKRRLMNGNKPVSFNQISIIVVGRNDNYGGDFSLRLKTTMDWNLKQLPGAELIYIEWNRIKEKASDCDWIEKRYPNVKCFTISNEVHQKITNNQKMPVMEYFAKNIGMRKATREWLLMINGDCLIGLDVTKNITKLNENYVYATNYVSFKWDQQPITHQHIKNKKTYTVTFPAGPNFNAAVGNFILCHKNNWLKATGYDESLTNVRAGVDSNGLNQLLHSGVKKAIIGTHYHLDHPESIVHGTNASHGVHQFNNIPYKNDNNWGFNDKHFKQISEKIWELKEI